ncbi:MAG: aspartate--tRNA(Asn) ligase [Candidatus Moranbacteria bacterium CG_4_9_14_3_um_filter_36_9]|nr:MAG: aspartate--tRNA(Asn) ligase [Candidatus Moranbacteria bacterium CG_4_9_14_3_um_filter_36_9]
MERTLIGETPKLVGKTVSLSGWVNIRRDHGKLIFIDLRDRTGIMQTVVIPDSKEAYETAKKLRSEFVVEIEGLVKARPASAVNQDSSTGGVELEAKKVNIISKPEGELAIDVSQESLDLKLETLLDNRTLALRNEKIKSIFKIYSELLSAYDEVMRKEGYVEIKTPKILSSATEGGANFFKIKYFDREACLAQSPQFYKQAGVSFFERVFEIGSVFRAEPHYTTRHVNEYIGLDGEVGFIKSFQDVMDELEKVVLSCMDSISKNCQEELKKYDAVIDESKPIPRITLVEAAEILEKEFGKKLENLDIDAEGERMICEWAKKKHSSDFIFLTNYPTALRPFYSMPGKDPEFTETFDLLFRGLEIASGGQRIHDYNQLVENIKKRKMKPEQFKDYLDIFKFGIPPHGGWGLGSERIVQKILGLGNIKEAILYPRDVKRLTP